MCGDRLKTTSKLCLLLLATVTFPAATGCSSFGNAKLVQQLRQENERLLTEFRAERQRREESEQLNETLEARLSESEKLLARQSQGVVPNRLSSLPGSGFKNSSGGRGSPTGQGGSAASADATGNRQDDFRWQRRIN